MTIGIRPNGFYRPGKVTVLAAVLSVVALAGCGRGLRYAETTVARNLTPRSPEHTQVLLHPQQPQCRFISTGVYRYSGYTVFNTEGSSIAAIREDAARRGLDGVYDLYCAVAGTVGADIGTCTAKGFVCQDR
jgi:hypothetical protein